MARPNATTFVAGNVLTAAQMNGIDTDLSTVYDDYLPYAVAAVYNSGTIAVTGGGTLYVPWDAEYYDQGGYHDNSTNNSRLTGLTAGLEPYIITLYISFNDSQAGIYDVRIMRNRTGVVAAHRINANAEAIKLSVTGITRLTNTDYVEAYVSTQANNTMTEQCIFSIARIGQV